MSKRAAKIQRALRECAICAEQRPLGDFPGKVTNACAHERDVCLECIARTIDLEVNGKGNSTRIICPHAGCPAELSYEDVKREASKDVFDRFDALLLRKSLQEERAFRWCANAGCGSGQIIEGLDVGTAGFNTWSQCHACRTRTCAFHRCVWHTERTCQQYDADARGSEEVALLQYFDRENVKRCPKCGHGIEKSGGCDHMTCRKEVGGCGAEFCIRCLADYNGPGGIRAIGNSAHKSSCPWYFPAGGEDDDELPDVPAGGE
jgi:hypothetical protein